MRGTNCNLLVRNTGNTLERAAAMRENMPSNKEQDASTEPMSDSKRSSVDVEDGTQNTKRQKQEILDIADTLCLKDGDRLEVLWDIEGKERWWGAKLLEFDGRTEDGVAIRTLLYDAWADGGFPEPSKEDVIFMGRDLIINYPSEEELNFRILSEDNSEVVWVSEIEEMVNGILDAALKKTEASFAKLPRARQASIAETIVGKKKKLVDMLYKHVEEQKEQGGQPILTAANAKAFLERTMMEDDK